MYVLLSIIIQLSIYYHIIFTRRERERGSVVAWLRFIFHSIRLGLATLIVAVC